MKKIITAFLFMMMVFPFFALASDNSNKLYSEYWVDGKWVSYSKYVAYLGEKARTFCSGGDKAKCDKYCLEYRVMAETEAEACSKKPAPSNVSVVPSVSQKNKEEEEAKKAEEKRKQEEADKKEEEIKNKFEKTKKENHEFTSGQKDKMNNIENKNSFMKFLVGPGYKNVGQLRSEIVINKKNISDLQDLLSETQSDDVKNSIKAELESMQNHQEEMISFVVANENHFSLFGWLAKLVE